jgi:acyl-coenzyme A thioesterase PaaI-like protein
MLSFPGCFVCGPDNPTGLHVTFEPDGPDGCRARYVPRDEHIGWPGRIHGGLQFTLMDEALAWALHVAGLRGVTAKAAARFREPVAPGDPLIVIGRVVERRRQLVRAHAELRRADASGALVAELDATMFLTKVDPAGTDTVRQNA